MKPGNHRILGAVAVLAACCSLCSGCGRKADPLPETFPVRGEVRYADGTPVGKGLIQFHAEDGAPLNISGTIDGGKFTIRTAFGTGTAAGAVAGRYRIAVTPEFELVPQTIRLADTYEVNPGPTELLIELP